MSILEIAIDNEFNVGELSKHYESECQSNYIALIEQMDNRGDVFVEQIEAVVAELLTEQMERAYRKGMKDCYKFFMDLQK